MERIKVKPCPVCKIGKPRMVHYAPPLKYSPELWEETENGFKSMATYKHIECGNCGAYAVGLNLSIDGAVSDWNFEDNNGRRTCIVQYIQDEELEVETLV